MPNILHILSLILIKTRLRYNYPQVTNDRIWIQKRWIISTRTGFDSRSTQFQITHFSKYIMLLQCSGVFLATINIWGAKAIHFQCKTEQSSNASSLKLDFIYSAYWLSRLRPPYHSLLLQEGLHLFLASMLGSQTPLQNWNPGFNCHWYILSSFCIMIINQQ